LKSVARIEVVVLAASAGGIEAVTAILRTLRPDFPAGVLVAMHSLEFEAVGGSTAQWRSRYRASGLAGTLRFVDLDCRRQDNLNIHEASASSNVNVMDGSTTHDGLGG
jgi:hypothetical protein